MDHMDILEIIWRSLTQNSVALTLLVFLLGLVYWIVTHPEKARKSARNVLRLQVWAHKHVLNLRTRLKRRIKAWKDQKSLNTVMDEVSEQTHSRIPKATIHYVEPSDATVEISAMQRNGVINIFVEDSGDDDTNLLKATLTFLKVALAPNLHLLARNLTKAMDLAILMRVLKMRNKQALCVIFWSSLFPEELTNPEVHEYLRKFMSMEEKGAFTGIAVSELQNLDGHPYYQAAIAGELDKLKSEVRQLTSFIEAVVNRAYGEPTPLEFQGTYVRVAILLVGRLTTKLHGKAPYIDRLISRIHNGVKRVYVIAVGEDNTALVKEISEHSIRGAAIMTDLKVFRPAVFNYRPTIVSLLLKTTNV